jgi:membrane protease YdiL (CAAX protease family)
MRPRVIALVIAMATPAIAFRLGGLALWTSYAAGMTIAAALATYVLWSDELLRDVMTPKGGDISVGALASAGLYLAVVLVFNLLVAPASEVGGLLRKCTLEGPRLPRLDAHGVTAAFEWMRGHVCRGYGASLGLLGPARGLLVVLIAALEEIAWRGGVQQALSERFGSTRGWLLASLLAGLAALGTLNPVLALLTLVGGVVWGALYRYRGRLAPAIFSHALFSYFTFHLHPLVEFR